MNEKPQKCTCTSNVLAKPKRTWTYSVHAIASKLHFAMAMLIVRSWIVHLTPIPCSLFHFCPNPARLPHYVYLT